MEITEKRLLKVISLFKIEGKFIDIKSNKHGHINSTFISTFSNGGKLEKYTHQRINKVVFTHPEEVMDNIVRVTDYISKEIDNYSDTQKPYDKERLVLQVIKTLDNTPYYIDEDGEYWRTYRYIDNAIAYDRCTSTELAHSLGTAVGTFQLELSGFDGSSLYTTIDNFHNMVMRYDSLLLSANEDRKGRRKEVEEDLAFLIENRACGEMIWKDYSSGKLPHRVTHNDTKMNNVLFDQESGMPLAVIDLDTIMPGTILFDTGDMIRTSCNTVEEDEKDLDKVEFDTAMFESLLSGYLDKTRSFLTANELKGILPSGRMMAQIMAVRFLTDYLNGDVYFRVDYPEHNLVRARNQIRLMESIDEKWEESETIARNLIGEV